MKHFMIYESAEFKTQTTTKTIAKCKNKINMQTTYTIKGKMSNKIIQKVKNIIRITVRIIYNENNE